MSALLFRYFRILMKYESSWIVYSLTNISSRWTFLTYRQSCESIPSCFLMNIVIIVVLTIVNNALLKIFSKMFLLTCVTSQYFNGTTCNLFRVISWWRKITISCYTSEIVFGFHPIANDFWHDFFFIFDLKKMTLLCLSLLLYMQMKIILRPADIRRFLDSDVRSDTWSLLAFMKVSA